MLTWQPLLLTFFILKKMKNGHSSNCADIVQMFLRSDCLGSPSVSPRKMKNRRLFRITLCPSQSRCGNEKRKHEQNVLEVILRPPLLLERFHLGSALLSFSNKWGSLGTQEIFPILIQVFVGHLGKGEENKNIFPSQKTSGQQEQMQTLERRQAAALKSSNPEVCLIFKTYLCLK